MRGVINTSMKNLFAVLMVVSAIFALPASANTLGQTCALIGSPAFYMGDACRAAGANNAYFNPAALSACARLTDTVSNQIIYACVIAIQNRAYSADQVSTCDNLSDVAQTISCFRSSGTPYGSQSGIPSLSVTELSNMIDYAIGAINNYQTQPAIDSLNAIKSKLNAAGSVSCR
jgi:hypothetical protein